MNKMYKKIESTDDSKIFHMLRYISDHPKITNFHKSIIIGLITYNGKGRIFPKLEALAERINSKDISGLSKGLNHLKKLGIIKIEKRMQKSSIYTFNYDILNENNSNEEITENDINNAEVCDTKKTTFLDSQYAEYETFCRKFMELNNLVIRTGDENAYDLNRKCLRIFGAIAAWNDGKTEKTQKQWEEIMITFFKNDNSKNKDIDSKNKRTLIELIGDDKYDSLMNSSYSFLEKLEEELNEIKTKTENESETGKTVRNRRFNKKMFYKPIKNVIRTPENKVEETKKLTEEELKERRIKIFGEDIEAQRIIKKKRMMTRIEHKEQINEDVPKNESTRKTFKDNFMKKIQGEEIRDEWKPRKIDISGLDKLREKLMEKMNI